MHRRNLITATSQERPPFKRGKVTGPAIEPPIIDVKHRFPSRVPRHCVDFGLWLRPHLHNSGGSASCGCPWDRDNNIRVRVHSLRLHAGMTSANTDNHRLVCQLGLHCYSNHNCLLTNICCNVLRSFLLDK